MDKEIQSFQFIFTGSNNNKTTTLMKLVSKVTGIYCIVDDFCKEYHSELNKTSLSLSNPSASNPRHRKRKG